MPHYRILPGKSFGLYRGGEIVEHEAQDAAPYVGTHLELVPEREPSGRAKTVQLASVPLPVALARFADMNAEETIQDAKQLTAAQRRELLAWERAGKNRTTIISALEAT